MARKSKSKKSRLRRARSNTSFFKPGDAKNIEQYIFASMMTGAFTAAGAVIGTILAKYLMKEVDQKLPMPAAFHAAVAKEVA